MKVQLVSLTAPISLDATYFASSAYKARLQCVIHVINNSTADLILFSGWTAHKKDISNLQKQLENSNCTAVLDVVNEDNPKKMIESKRKSIEEDTGNTLTNELYVYQSGVLTPLKSRQVFATSAQVGNNRSLIEKLIIELEQRRQIIVAGRKCLILVCGELNILANEQMSNNAVRFRLPSEVALQQRFENVLNDCDIVLNPIHSPMGNQGKMHMRRMYLCRGDKAYFSAANMRENHIGYFKSYQYACIGKKGELDLSQWAKIVKIPLTKTTNPTTACYLSSEIKI